MASKKKLVIVDIDDTIVLIAPKWIGESFKESVIFNRVKNWAVVHAAMDGKEAFAKAIMDRTVYDLPTWLGLPGIARNVFADVYKNNGTFYQGLLPTKFGSELMLRNHSAKLVFLTHVLGGNSDQSKYDWIYSNFKNADFAYEAVDINTKKSEVINKLYGDFDVFVDDHPGNLMDVMQNCNSENKEFIFPSYGYNQGMILSSEELAKTKKFSLKTF
jgi:hypothetical protein